MHRDHPCYGCQAVAVDHAIICPALGVIASGRCKGIRGRDRDAAFDRLYGWAVSPNHRRLIRLRSAYWQESDAPYVARTADAEGTLYLAQNGSTHERSTLAGKATRGRGDHGRAKTWRSGGGLKRVPSGQDVKPAGALTA